MPASLHMTCYGSYLSRLLEVHSAVAYIHRPIFRSPRYPQSEIRRIPLQYGADRKTLLEAKDDEDEWPGIFISTTGLVLFGTLFREAEGMSWTEILAAALREYDADQVQGVVLKILEPRGEFLQALVDKVWKDAVGTQDSSGTLLRADVEQRWGYRGRAGKNSMYIR
jgi:hypothetical protein